MHKHVPDRPIAKDELPVLEEIYPVIDNDLAHDNLFTEAKQTEILNLAESVVSKSEMQELVNGLSAQGS